MGRVVRRQNRGDEWMRVVGRIGDELLHAPLQFCVMREGYPLGESRLDATAR